MPQRSIQELTTYIMRDGSRCFLALPPNADWYAVRDHISKLHGAVLTKFLTDEVTECWIDFDFSGHKFSVNDAPGDYWFFVENPGCPEPVLIAVADHFSELLR
jgi:hypothetical protein